MTLHANIYLSRRGLQKSSLETLQQCKFSFLYHVRIKIIFVSCELLQLMHGVVGQMQILIHSGFAAVN